MNKDSKIILCSLVTLLGPIFGFAIWYNWREGLMVMGIVLGITLAVVSVDAFYCWLFDD